MESISAVEFGKLMQAVEDQNQRLVRIERKVDLIEEQVQGQAQIITKGRTAIYVLFWVGAAAWGAFKFFFGK